MTIGVTFLQHIKIIHGNLMIAITFSDNMNKWENNPVPTKTKGPGIWVRVKRLVKNEHGNWVRAAGRIKKMGYKY